MDSLSLKSKLIKKIILHVLGLVDKKSDLGTYFFKFLKNCCGNFRLIKITVLFLFLVSIENSFAQTEDVLPISIIRKANLPSLGGDMIVGPNFRASPVVDCLSPLTNDFRVVALHGYDPRTLTGSGDLAKACSTAKGSGVYFAASCTINSLQSGKTNAENLSLLVERPVYGLRPPGAAYPELIMNVENVNGVSHISARTLAGKPVDPEFVMFSKGKNLGPVNLTATSKNLKVIRVVVDLDTPATLACPVASASKSAQTAGAFGKAAGTLGKVAGVVGEIAGPSAAILGPAMDISDGLNELHDSLGYINSKNNTGQDVNIDGGRRTAGVYSPYERQGPWVYRQILPTSWNECPVKTAESLDAVNRSGGGPTAAGVHQGTISHDQSDWGILDFLGAVWW